MKLRKIVLAAALMSVLLSCFDGFPALAASPGVVYCTHVQTYGWQEWKENGQLSGTTGESKRLEGIRIKLQNAPANSGITYRTHVQTYGWQDWKSDDQLSGTTGEARRLEAIQIKLTGDIAENYDVYYRVHAQTYGWLDWAKNGQSAGTAGYAKRLEAVEIRLVTKGAAAPGSTDRPFVSRDGDTTIDNGVAYRTHAQTYGWQDWKYNGSMAGTTGEAKRLEGICIVLTNQRISGQIQYRTHVQTYGWQDWKSDGQMAGTSGEARRLEAIQIRLTGELAAEYDVYYRVHVQSYGWLDWARNGAATGTEGLARRLESIEIRLEKKGASAPGRMETAFIAGNGQFISGEADNSKPPLTEDVPDICPHDWEYRYHHRTEGHYERMAIKPGYDVADAWRMHQYCSDCGAEITGNAHNHVKDHHPEVEDTEYGRYFYSLPEILHAAESHPPEYGEVWAEDAVYQDIARTCRLCGVTENETKKIEEHFYELLEDAFDNGYDEIPRIFCEECGEDITGNLNHTIYTHRTSYYTGFVPTRVVHYTGFVGCRDCGKTINSNLTDYQ